MQRWGVTFGRWMPTSVWKRIYCVHFLCHNICSSMSIKAICILCVEYTVWSIAMYVLTANIEIWPHAVVQMVGSAIRCLDKSLSMFLSSLILIHWSFCQVALKQWRIIKPSPQKLVAAAANERWLFTKQFTYLEGFGVLRRWSVRGTRQAYDQNLPTNAQVYSERSDFIILSRAVC